MTPTPRSAQTPPLRTGRFAPFRGPHCAPGSGAPARRLIATPLTVLCAFFALLVLSAGAAQAEPPKLISYGQFKSVTTNPVGVAVDNSADASSADVYVTGLYNESGESPDDKFDASGKLLSPPSPFGENFDFGVSAAVNPTNGDLYVLSALGSIAAITESGAPEGSFPVALTGEVFGFLSSAPQIAANAVGDVYVPDPFKETSPGSEKYEPNDEIHEYGPTGTLLGTFTDNGALKEPNGVAVDSAGDLWVADHGNSRIVELNSSGAPVEVNGKRVEIQSEGVQTVALDGHGDVLAISRTAKTSVDRWHRRAPIWSSTIRLARAWPTSARVPLKPAAIACRRWSRSIKTAVACM